MKLFSVFRKSLREQVRGAWMLLLTLSIASLFVVMYWLITGGGSTTYGVLVINRDAGTGGEQAIKAIQEMAYANGQLILNVIQVVDRAEAEEKLRNREAAALIIFPSDFSRVLQSAREAGTPITTSVIFSGDLTNPFYTMVSVMTVTAVDNYVQATVGQPRPIEFKEEPLGASAARTEFETYVPALLILSVVMLIFQVAMTVAREVEGGTLRRLQLTHMTSFDLLGGISATQVLIGVASVVLTFLTATALGFHSQGPLWVAILIGAMTSLSIVGVGLLVACFSRTVSEAFIYANFPLILLMFFTGAVFPIPPIPLFTIGGRTIALFDFLPPTHAVVALNKVLTLGAGITDVAYELIVLFVLSVIYFAAGVWLFKRIHLRAQ
jgi:ABC-2 type transport system permease protein